MNINPSMLTSTHCTVWVHFRAILNLKLCCPGQQFGFKCQHHWRVKYLYKL